MGHSIRRKRWQPQLWPWQWSLLFSLLTVCPVCSRCPELSTEEHMLSMWCLSIYNLLLSCDVALIPALCVFTDIRCPFCSKPFPGGRIEDHLLSCLTSPPLPYNSQYRNIEMDQAAVSFSFVLFLDNMQHCTLFSVFVQRTCSAKTVENAPSVWRIWSREKRLLDWRVCASTIRGNKPSKQ